MDQDGKSFSFVERQRHFRNLLKYWAGCLNQLKIDLVMCDIIPHRVSDYVLYLLCKYYNIQFLTFLYHRTSNRFIPITNIFEIDDNITEKYKELFESNKSLSDLKKLTANEFLAAITNINKNYESGKPEYEKPEKLKDRKSSNVFGLSIKFINDLLITNKKRYFGKKGFLKKGIGTYYKLKNRCVEESSTSMLLYALFKIKTNRYKKSLSLFYKSLTSVPDLDKPYILFNLHYQPEMTTSPSGDIFVDQNLCIDTLLKNIPDNYFVYVKEHPAQFHSHREGHTGRNKYFYKDLLKNPRVVLLPIDYDPYDLMKKAIAVSTVTGTSGWEAMVLGKPVICFGLTWYEKFPNVYKVYDNETSKGILSFINNYKFDERSLIAYLAAFSQSSVQAYYLRGMKEELFNQSETECVDNIVDVVLKNVK